jgi:MFS superfamily sulfate permease-like transporter
LAMAFAIASGVKPEAGIFTAVIGGFIISALGGSRAAAPDKSTKMTSKNGKMQPTRRHC